MNFTLKLVLLAALTLVLEPYPARSFIPFPFVDKECKTSWNIIKICPRYCASKHPGRLLWGLACICCKIQGDTGHLPTALNPTVRTKPTTETPSTTISSLDTLRMLLQQLKEENRIPPVEADNWIARLGTVNKTLLTIDEQVVLTNLLIRAGVPWQTVLMLLGPISEEVPVGTRPPATSSSDESVTGRPMTEPAEDSAEISTPMPSASLPEATSKSTTASLMELTSASLPEATSKSTTVSLELTSANLPEATSKSTTASLMELTSASLPEAMSSSTTASLELTSASLPGATSEPTTASATTALQNR